MAYGFAAYTATSGIVQVDENYTNLCLRQTGTATVTNRHPASEYTTGVIAKTVDITYSGQADSMPFIFLSGTATGGSSFGVLRTSKSGNTWTFRVVGYDHAPTFKYYIFDLPSSTGSGYGFEVYKADGSVAFTSLYWPLSMVACQMSGSVTLTGGRQYASGGPAKIVQAETSEMFTNQEVWTYWQNTLDTIGLYPSGSNITAGWQSQHIAGGVISGGGSPTPPQDSALGGWGMTASAFSVIDVQTLDGTIEIGGSVSVTADATTRSVVGTGSGFTTSPYVTIAASGGSAPYSYSWVKLSGDNIIVASGSTTSNAFRTTTSSATSSGQSFSAVYQCVVTDAIGRVGYSPAITFNHSQPSVRLTPAPMTWPNQIWSSANESVYGAYSALGPNVSGLSQIVRFKFEIISMVDTLTAGSWSIVSINGSTHTNLVTGLSYNLGSSTILNVGNDANLTIKLEGHTTAKTGQRGMSGQIRVTNLDDNNAVVGTFNISLIVDNDNSSDQTPNPITWTSHNASTNDYWIESKQASNTRLAGVSQPITLTWTVSNVSKSSGGTAYLDIYKNYGFQGRINITGNGQNVSMTVANNDLIEIVHSLSTGAGRQTVSYNVAVTNSSTGAGFGSYSTSLVVDNDNNYNVADVTPNAIGFFNHSVNTTNANGQSAHSPINISGINAPIELEWSISNLSKSGGTAYLDIYRNWTFIQRVDINSNYQSGSVVVNNGDLVEIVHYFNNSPQGGRKTTSYNVTVYNKTDGYATLGYYSVSGAVG